MSQIAQALAKAKERTGHTTAPFMTPGLSAGAAVVPERSAGSPVAARKVRDNRAFWLVLGCVSLPLTAFVLWMQLDEAGVAPKSGAPVALPPPVATSAALPEAPARVVVSAPLAGSTPALRPKAATAPSAATPRPEIASRVASLSISAVMPGEPARIMLAGRVIRAGEPADGELTFVGIAEGQLRFTDARGALYTRYY